MPLNNLSGTLLALLMCANVTKARSLPKSGASGSCFTLVGSGLTATIRQENLDKDKNSSFPQTFINYGCKTRPETLKSSASSTRLPPLTPGIDFR